ncbi:hypothetical protein [Sulfitobacter sp. S190]|uniref:hypothetical protein n=1 Tax=Sulfitobacter sp. S190 TaxID=2867022 RepID=UPI0021A82CC3|nr:hypothetical protein [Sulfitobacter sp. S190]UWR23981.1 hypothetical protein K3756_08540 [Sulfitobacter sp. S190]
MTAIKSAAIATVLFFLLSLVVNISGETMTEKVTGALLFGVIYTVIGLAIDYFKKVRK